MLPPPVRLTLAQTDCVLGDVEGNARRSRELIAAAAADGPALVVFPELSLTGYALEAGAGAASRPAEAALDAVPPGASAVVGLIEAGRVHVHNTAVWVDDGAVRATQRKLYLPTYGPFEERKLFTPGAGLRAFDTPLGRVAVLTCFDAWQPQLAFLAAQDGAEILLAPAASSDATPGIAEDWRTITRFYARMLGVWVAFVNRVGREDGFTFWGGSHLVDPWGEIVVEAPRYAEAVVGIELDPEAVRRRRQEAPLVKEARLGLLVRELERLIEEGGDL